jgi:hypothetical protein
MIPVTINKAGRRLWIHPQALEAFKKITPQLAMPKTMDGFVQKMESLPIEELVVEALSNHASTRKFATQLLKKRNEK